MSSIPEEGAISAILDVRSANVRNEFLRNGTFEGGSLAGWKDTSGTVTIQTSSFQGNYCAFLSSSMSGYLYQYITILSNRVYEIRFWWKAGYNEYPVLLYVGYSDGTTTSGSFGSEQVTPTWTQYGFTPSRNKLIQYIAFKPTNTGSYGYLDSVELVEFTGWSEATSFGTNLSLTGNTGSIVLSGSTGVKIQLFDAGYTSNAGGYHYFYFGTSSIAPSNKKLCVFSGSGNIHQEFYIPRVGDVGDNLYLFSTVSDYVYFDVGYAQASAVNTQYSEVRYMTNTGSPLYLRTTNTTSVGAKSGSIGGSQNYVYLGIKVYIGTTLISGTTCVAVADMPEDSSAEVNATWTCPEYGTTYNYVKIEVYNCDPSGNTGSLLQTFQTPETTINLNGSIWTVYYNGYFSIADTSCYFFYGSSVSDSRVSNFAWGRAFIP